MSHPQKSKVILYIYIESMQNVCTVPVCRHELTLKRYFLSGGEREKREGREGGEGGLCVTGIR